MKRVAVLGAGRVGSLIAADLAADDAIAVTVADASAEALGRLSASCGAHTVRADLSSPAELARVLASCDAVITKPGYGMFTEAACNGVPVLYVTRRDWPEEPCLVQWLRQNAACLEVERGMLLAGELGDALQQLWALPLPPRPDATGAVAAAEFLKATFF